MGSDSRESFKVAFSLKSKLLISVVLLLIIVIAFLNLSTIIILKEDKRAYVYQSQSTQAVLSGKEFLNLTNRAIGTLRNALASIDPRRTLTQNDRNAFQAVIDNQKDVVGIRVTLLNLNNQKLVPVVDGHLKEKLSSQSVQLSDFGLAPEQLKRAIPQLLEKEFAIMNISRVGAPPTLALLLADVRLKNNPGGMPVAFGFVFLNDFLKDLQGVNITIADQSGWILYDTNPENLFSPKQVLQNSLFKAAQGTSLSTGAQEYLIDNTQTLGSFFKPGLGITALSNISLKKAMRSADVLTAKFLLLAGAAVGAAMIFALFFARSLTAPLKQLYEATKEVAQGHFDLNLKVKSRDEIGALSGSFSVMSEKIQDLIKESMEKVRLEGELEVANAVQQSLIPPHRHVSERLKIESHYKSASECGGDWWGFFKVDNRVALMIADATGHGVPSALITAAARSCFSVMHQLAHENPNFPLSPAEMLKFANRAIFESSGGKIMMTFFVGVIDFDTHVLTYASAGHNPPWLFHKAKDSFKMKSLTSKGSRLGERADAKPYAEKKVRIEEGDILFLYTDGILEGTNLNGTQYGKKQVMNLVKSSLEGGPELVIHSLIKDFMKFNEGKALDDDVTLAAATILPRKPVKQANA